MENKSYLNQDINSRGLRNNNPGNIKYNAKNPWLGKIPHAQNKDKNKVHEQFQTLAYGIRAFFILSRNYVTKYKADTLRKFLSKYAPSSENNTNAYIKAIEKTMGIKADDKLNLLDRKFHIQFAAAIFIQELGLNYYKMIPIEALHYGYKLAFEKNNSGTSNPITSVKEGLNDMINPNSETTTPISSAVRSGLTIGLCALALVTLLKK